MVPEHRDSQHAWPAHLAMAVAIHGVATELARGECSALAGAGDETLGMRHLLLRAMHLHPSPEAFRHYLAETVGYCPEAVDSIADLVAAAGAIGEAQTKSDLGVTLLEALMGDPELQAALDLIPPPTRAVLIRTALARAGNDVYRFLDIVISLATFWRATQEPTA